jgi:hypothetical protein
MASYNDVTGDKIQSKATSIPSENWEAIFGLSKFQKDMLKKKEQEKQNKNSSSSGRNRVSKTQ